MKNKKLCIRTMIIFCMSILSFVLLFSCCGWTVLGSDSENRIMSPSKELISPEHTITNTNTTIPLHCESKVASSGMVDVFKWKLLVKPEGSGALLTANNANASLTIDSTEGYYIIELAIYKNNNCIGIDYAYIGTPSVVHYIWAGAGGANTGADWSNAWTSLPATLVRGHTYYIADGTYSPYYCNTPQDGVVPIYIKKAIPLDHGTNTGWVSGTMGSSQAIFLNSASASPFTCNSNYIVIDGQVGIGKGDVEQHGFLFNNNSTTLGYAFLIGHNIGIATSVHNVKLKHAEITAPRGRGFQVHSMVTQCSEVLIHSCHIHDVVAQIYFASTNYSIVEYCYLARNHSDPISHSEGLQTTPDDKCKNNIIRYNIWEDIEGTAVIVGSDYWDIYGNIFFWTQAYVDSDPVDRHIVGRTCNQGVAMGIYDAARIALKPSVGCKVFNNTIVGKYPVSGVSFSGRLSVYFPTADRNYTYNNLWVDCDKLPTMGGTNDYNMYYNNNLVSLFVINEAHIQNVGSNPLNSDFTLNAETSPGLNLQEKFGGIYSYDMYGIKRGLNGVWSRGALQFH